MIKTTVGQALVALTPTASWSLANSYDYSTCVWLSPNIPQPTPVVVSTQQAYMDSQAPLLACSNTASQLLTATDWTTIPDVANPAVSNPYLTNQAAFLAYRSQVRQIGVYPVADPVWPAQPAPQWANATANTTSTTVA
jgi:hypothetical protein